MTNWTHTRDIRDWFPKDIETFANRHDYSYNRYFETNCHPYKEHIVFEAPGKNVELHTTTDETLLGHITIAKEIMWNHPLATSTYVTTNIDLPLNVTPERFFAFVDEQLNCLLESICS